MTSTNPEQKNEKDVFQTSDQPSEDSPESPISSTSATTQDEPAFGWSAYAERVNGRFAMVGFIAILLIEALSKESFLRWAGMLP